MRILPVLDLKNGLVVRGLGGRREEYRPVQSVLTPSCQPVEVARAFRDRLGLSEFYVADLDAIAGGEQALGLYRALEAAGFRLWVDAGIRRAAAAAPLVEAGVERLIAGLETVEGPWVLQDLCRQWGGRRVVFSLDLKNGVPLGNKAAWPQPDAESIARHALSTGVGGLVVLDLARVGAGEGTGTEELCRRLCHAYPAVDVVAGGGVRDAADMRRLHACGVSAVLIASALHEGRLGPGAWEGLD